jgi:hypothetical protein
MEGKIGCVYQDSHCVLGLCSSLDEIECEINIKCEILVVYDNDNPTGIQKCWENNCINFNSEVCPEVGCVVDKLFGDDKCLFDECNTYSHTDCDNVNECVYTFSKGCNKGICDDIGIDIINCGMNEKCDVVNGKCEVGCKSDCEAGPYCLLENNDKCSFDECSQWTSNDCYNHENCIWDNSISFNEYFGLCKTGDCGNLESEENCNNILNHNKCSFVRGLCMNNPCIVSDCTNENTRGCILQETNCVVDECMKYDEETCKTEGIGKCVLTIMNNEYRCVIGNCSMLDCSNDCIINDARCKIVKNECVENPCVNGDCDSYVCLTKEDDSNQCIYDNCAQYTPSGIFIK